MNAAQLGRLLRRDREGAGEIRSFKEVGDPPVSINQEGRLFLEWLSCRKGILLPQLNTGVTLWVRGPVEPNSLRRALNETIQSHETLRTCFVTAESASPGDYVLPSLGQPRYRQRIVSQIDIDLPVEDFRLPLNGVPLDQLTREVGRFVDSPFRYDVAPLIRAKLIRFGTVVHLLVIVVGHLLFDRSSGVLLRKELNDRYDALLNNREYLSPPSAPRYADFSQWQRTALAQAEFDSGRRYWLRRWQDDRDVRVELSRFARPARRVWRPRPKSSVIEAPLLRSVRAAATRGNATTYTVAFAALAILLRACTGSGRVAIWSHSANRVREGAEHIIGWLANTHRIVVNMEDDPPVDTVLDRVRHSLLDAATNQEIPLPLVYADVYRDSGALPDFFQGLYVSLDYVGVTRSTADRGQLLRPADSLTLTNAGLEIVIRDNGSTARIKVFYSGSRFSGEVVSDLLGALKRTLEWTAACPTSRVSELPIEVSEGQTC